MIQEKGQFFENLKQEDCFWREKQKFQKTFYQMAK